MSLVASLLQAIVSVDGEALVMHASERPYIVSPSGQVELARGGFTFDAVGGILTELLPAEFQHTLQEAGAVQYSLPPQAEFPREQFTIVVARGADDVWAEIRRRRMPDDDPLPDPFLGPSQDHLAGSVIGMSDWSPMARPANHLAERAADVASRSVCLPVVTPALRSDVPSTDRPARAEVSRGLDVDDVRVDLEMLLRTAADFGASRLYLVSDTRPLVRVDGALQYLEQAPVLTPDDISALLRSAVPLTSGWGTASESFRGVTSVGQVRCTTFTDRHGPGAVFRFTPSVLSVEQLALPPEIQAMAMERQGLVLISGPRQSGKRTLLSALVDLINRTRCEHIVTIDREIGVVHASGKSIVSQREVRAGDDALAAAARAALDEDPDVLVIDAIRTSALMDVALEAAASGCLVLGGLVALNAAESVERAVKLYQPELARYIRLALADRLRGVVAQILLPKVGGGRVAAREVLLNTPAVAAAIANGDTSQLLAEIDAGRGHGMAPLNEAVLSCVRNRVVDVREAYRHVSDAPGFLALLERDGIDTSAIEFAVPDGR